MPVTDVKPPQQRSTTRTKTGRGGRGSKSTAAVDRSSTPVIIEDEDSKDALATSANAATSVVNSGIPDQTLASTEVNSLYPGLNDMADALEALPMELIRHFTLLREIDAKCIVTMPELNRLIKDLFKLPIPEPTEVQLVQEREQILTRIRQLIRELMPCLEEKMHVAGVAAEAISRHVARLDYDYEELITGQNEIPHIVRYGPKEHPAYLPIITPAEQKPLSSSRSESRREAMAAKKAAAAAAKADAATNTDGNGSSTRGGARGTPRPDEKVSGSGSKSNSSTRGTSGGGSKASSGAGSKQSTSNVTTNTTKRRKAASAIGTPVVESAELAGSDSKVNMPNSDSVKPEYGDDVDSSVATGSKRSRNGNGSTSSRKRGAHGNGVSSSAASESLRSSRASKSNGKNNDEKPNSSSNSSNRRRGGSNSSSSNKRGEDYEEFDDYEEDDVQDEGDANEEQVYCYCQQVSFGEMVGCDGPDCKIEWFHLPCIGLSQPPVGQWFCNDCAKKREKSDGKGDSGGKSDADKKDESKIL